MCCSAWRSQVRKYIDQEIRGPSNQLPPLEDGLALNVIRAESRRFRRHPPPLPHPNPPVVLAA